MAYVIHFQLSPGSGGGGVVDRGVICPKDPKDPPMVSGERTCMTQGWGRVLKINSHF